MAPGKAQERRKGGKAIADWTPLEAACIIAGMLAPLILFAIGYYKAYHPDPDDEDQGGSDSCQ